MTQMPNEEQRGGDRPDWDNVVAGEPLPERQEHVLPQNDYDLFMFTPPEDPWLVRAREILDEGKP